jgi:hypothetical protein
MTALTVLELRALKGAFGACQQCVACGRLTTPQLCSLYKLRGYRAAVMRRTYGRHIIRHRLEYACEGLSMNAIQRVFAKVDTDDREVLLRRMLAEV